MWVLKHVELVNDVELDFAEVGQIVRRLLTATFVLTLISFSKFLVDLVLDARVPAADVTIVKSG